MAIRRRKSSHWRGGDSSLNAYPAVYFYYWTLPLARKTVTDIRYRYSAPWIDRAPVRTKRLSLDAQKS